MNFNLANKPDRPPSNALRVERWRDLPAERVPACYKITDDIGRCIMSHLQKAWPEAFSNITVNDTCKVRATIAARETPPRENVQATDWAGKVIAEVLGFDLAKASDKARIKVMLKKWTETNVLRIERMTYGDKNKDANFVVAGENNPAVME